MEEKKHLGMDLTEGSILKKLLIFMLPLLAANVVQQAYNTVDLIVIGHYMGAEGTVGVSVGGQAAQLLTMIAMGIAVGGQVYISQLAGAKRRDLINDAVGTLFTFVGIVSFALLAFGLIFSEQIIRWMGTPPEAITETRNYMIITFLGFPFISGYNAVCSVLRGLGDSRRPLLFITIAAVSNIFMDILLVAVFKMASAGTAIATVIGQGLSFIFSIVYLYKRRDSFGFDFKLNSFRIRGEHLKIFLKLGLPQVVQSACIFTTVIYVNSLINAYGLIASATNSVGSKITNLANTITQSMNQSCSATIGQCLAAKKQERAKKVVLLGLVIAMGIALFNSLLILCVPKAIFSVFSKEQAVVDFGVEHYLIPAVLAFFLSSIMGPLQSMVTGSGFAILGLLVGLLDGVVFRLMFSWLFADVMNMGVDGYFYANSLARLAPCLVCGAYFLSGKWRTRKLLVKDDGNDSKKDGAVEKA